MIAALFVFLAIGSFLNSVGYRLLHLHTFHKIRSFCPACSMMISWYDNIPLISWLVLRGKCRSCTQPISWLYPFIELITTVYLIWLWCMVPAPSVYAYLFFFAALIVSIRTDFDQLLISRFVTLYAIPTAWIAIYLKILPISYLQSFTGTLCGYALLWAINRIHRKVTGHDGIGQGDFELLAFIGAYTGIFGCWMSMLIGSCVGTFISIIVMLITGQKSYKIPFGAYLAFGAMHFVLHQNWLIELFLSI